MEPGLSALFGPDGSSVLHHCQCCMLYVSCSIDFFCTLFNSFTVLYPLFKTQSHREQLLLEPVLCSCCTASCSFWEAQGGFSHLSYLLRSAFEDTKSGFLRRLKVCHTTHTICHSGTAEMGLGPLASEPPMRCYLPNGRAPLTFNYEIAAHRYAR